jgi:hypothetical protein
MEGRHRIEAAGKRPRAFVVSGTGAFRHVGEPFRCLSETVSHPNATT